MTKIDWPNTTSIKRLKIIEETQDLLVQTNIASEFTARNDNLVAVKRFWDRRLADRNIRVAKADKCIIFYKKFNLRNPHDKIGELKNALEAPHNELGDCLFIDFGVAIPEAQNEQSVRAFFLNDPTARYVMGVRRGVIFIFSIKEAEIIANKASSMGFISVLPDALR